MQGLVAGVLTHESLGTELLVLGLRGHGGFTGPLLGSATRRSTTRAARSGSSTEDGHPAVGPHA
jgi:hypothetical protein